MRKEQAEVVVVGAGMAGLCAAVAASERGADVLVVEKGPRVGGSMLLSGGLIWTFADKAQLKREIPDGNEALQELVIDALADSHAWLHERGVSLDPETSFQWYGRGRVADPRSMASTLAERVVANGGRIRLATGMQDLVLTDAEVAGISAFDDAGTLRIGARSVILATGGFQGNADLVSRYITPYADCLYLRSNPWSTGDGFLAAAAVGAAATPHLGAFYGHALAAPPARFSQFEFLNVTQRYGQRVVALNLQGRRFVDESAGTGEEALNLAVAAQPQATAVYIVDEAIASGQGQRGYPPRAAIERARSCGGPVVESATLEGLVEKLADWNIPPDPALESLQAYNASIRKKRGRGLFPPRSRHAVSLDVPPFTAVMVRAGITFTCGGLQSDLDMNVLRRAATTSTLPLVRADSSELLLTPIGNLFAAGCDLGGISTSGYMGGLATALVTGRIAGDAAARNARAMT